MRNVIPFFVMNQNTDRGGDNFNAGFCYTLFNEFNLFESLLVANAVAGSYVKTGISPDVSDLIQFLEHFSR